MSFKKDCINVFSQLRDPTSILTIKGYQNSYGEIADYNLILNVSYEQALRNSIDIVKNFSLSLSDYEKQKFSIEDLMKAREELLVSMENSVGKASPKVKEVYRSVVDDYGKTVRGLKEHIKNESLHLFGFMLNKTVFNDGNKPIIKKAAKTLAKEYLRKRTPLSKFVQFKLDKNKFEELVCGDKSLRGIDK
jgi:hypothetical protein